MKDIFIAIFSSTVISAVITTIYNSFTNNRKDILENIVKERKTWRDELRVISCDVAQSKNLKELKKAIGKLKVRINPFGLSEEIIFYDSYIWKEIRKLESCYWLPKNNLEKRKVIFINLISCLLKFDWERSKNEIKGSVQTKVVMTEMSACFVFQAILLFYNNIEDCLIDFVEYCVVYIITITFYWIIISFADKWKDRNQLISYIEISILLIVAIFILWYNFMIPHFKENIKLNLIISFIPLLTLLYSAGIKMCIYRQNIKFYILSSMIAVREREIDKRYNVFFNKEDKQPQEKELVYKD